MTWKVAVGLASHWPCVTDLSGLSASGSRPRQGDEHTRLRSLVEYGPFTLPAKNGYTHQDAVGRQTRVRSRTICTIWEPDPPTGRGLYGTCTWHPHDTGRVPSSRPPDATSSTQQGRHAAAMRTVATTPVANFSSATIRHQRDSGVCCPWFSSEEQQLSLPQPLHNN